MKTPPTQTLRPQIHCLIIIAAIFAVYHQVAGHRFIEFDDAVYIYGNTRVIEGPTWPNIIWAFTNMDAANWHPVTWLSHLADRALFGEYPGGYLLMNVAWHSLAAIFCYIGITITTGKRFIGLAVAVFFALHPVNVESVAWASSRKSLLDAAFWFAGIICYINFIRTNERKLYLLTVIFHILGLMSKSMHVTFPCTLWLAHMAYYISHNRVPLSWMDAAFKSEIKRALKLSTPMLILSLYFCFVTMQAQTQALSPIEYLSIEGRIINATTSVGRYMVAFFHPTEFAAFYPLFVEDITWASTVVPILAILGISIGVLYTSTKRPLLLIGWLWFLGTLVPVIGLVQVGSQSHADRYLYIPGIGLALMMASFVNNAPPSIGTVRLRNTWLLVSALSLSTLTYFQVAYWKDGVTLFRHSLAITGDCLTSVSAVICSYARQGRNAEGIAFTEEVLLRTKKTDNQKKFNTYLAALYLQNGDPLRALSAAKKCLSFGVGEKYLYVLAATAAYKSGNTTEAVFFVEKANNTVNEFDRGLIAHHNLNIMLSTLELNIKKAAP